MFSQALLHAMNSMGNPPPNTSMATSNSANTIENNLRQQFGRLLPEMRELGITDDNVSLRALQVSNGDVEAAINLIFAGLIDEWLFSSLIYFQADAKCEFWNKYCLIPWKRIILVYLPKENQLYSSSQRISKQIEIKNQSKESSKYLTVSLDDVIEAMRVFSGSKES